MSVTEDASFSTRAEAIRFVLREVNLARLSPEVADWFFYVKDFFGKGGLYDQCGAIVDKELRKKFKVLDWEGTWQYVCVPHVGLVVSGLPYLSFDIDLHVSASTRVTWYYAGEGEPLEYEVIPCVVVAEVQKAVEQLVLPMVFLKAAVDGDLTSFDVVESDFNFTTWLVPGFDHKVKLHSSLIPVWQQTFQGRALAGALTHFGLISAGQSLLLDQVISGNKAAKLDEVVDAEEAAPFEEHKLRIRLQELGFSRTQIDEAISNTSFGTGCSLEQAVRLALDYFGPG